MCAGASGPERGAIRRSEAEGESGRRSEMASGMRDPGGISYQEATHSDTDIDRAD